MGKLIMFKRLPMNSVLLLITTAIFFSSSAFADSKSYYGGEESLFTDSRKVKEARKGYSGSFSQKVDHFNSDDTREFSQRFYMNHQYARGESSPVLLYICGEAECKSSSLNGQIRQHAKSLGAHMVALEHRFYGKSQPFKDLSTENLRYLSTAQALADLDYFQKQMMLLRDELQFSDQWIAIGGSYAGNLAAFYRLKYPENVVGALASSAPVRAHESFKEYDAHVTKVAGEQCVSDMQNVYEAIEADWDNGAAIQRWKSLFGATSIKDRRDFLYMVTDVAAAAVQYGMREEFCTMISGPNKAKGYAGFAKKLFSRWGMAPVDLTFQSAESTELPTGKKFGMRAWLYQSCTEYGFWQIAHDDETMRTRSKYIDLEFHRESCKRLFGLAEPAATRSFNDTYFHPIMDGEASYIYFTNGTDDPWSTLSILETDITDIDVFNIDGAAHCDDLRRSLPSDSPSLKKSRKMFLQRATYWLNLD